jgi:hypothetical protein
VSNSGDDGHRCGSREHADELERDAALERRARCQHDERGQQRSAYTAAGDHRHAADQDAQLGVGRHTRLDRPPRELGGEQEARGVDRCPLVGMGWSARQAHGLLGSEQDEPGHERGATAQRQPGAETKQRTGGEGGDNLAVERAGVERGDCERDGDEQRPGRSR